MHVKVTGVSPPFLLCGSLGIRIRLSGLVANTLTGPSRQQVVFEAGSYGAQASFQLTAQPTLTLNSCSSCLYF